MILKKEGTASLLLCCLTRVSTRGTRKIRGEQPSQQAHPGRGGSRTVAPAVLMSPGRMAGGPLYRRVGSGHPCIYAWSVQGQESGSCSRRVPVVWAGLGSWLPGPRSPAAPGVFTSYPRVGEGGAALVASHPWGQPVHLQLFAEGPAFKTSNPLQTVAFVKCNNHDIGGENEMEKTKAV